MQLYIFKQLHLEAAEPRVKSTPINPRLHLRILSVEVALLWLEDLAKIGGVDSNSDFV
jgi:hypothetical protein